MTMSLLRTIQLTRATLVCAAVLCVWSSSAPASAPQQKRLPPGTAETGMLTVSPDRWEDDVEPGKTTTFHLSLTNRTGQDAELELVPTDVAPSDTGLVRATDRAEAFGAGNWVEPEVRTLSLDNMHEVTLAVRVTPPLQAPVGSNFGGLLAILKSKESRKTGSAQVGFEMRALVQIYPRVPGQISRQVKVTAAEIADSFVFTGNRFVSYEVEFANEGNVNEYVSGQVLVRSMFGNTVRTLNIRDMLILRGDRRRARVLWTNPPAFGRFTAETRIESSSGTLAKKFPAVVILPPWWWFALAAGALLVPALYWWYRRRNAWKQYLDEDWDDEIADDWDGDQAYS